MSNYKRMYSVIILPAFSYPFAFMAGLITVTLFMEEAPQLLHYLLPESDFASNGSQFLKLFFPTMAYLSILSSIIGVYSCHRYAQLLSEGKVSISVRVNYLVGRGVGSLIRMARSFVQNGHLK